MIDNSAIKERVSNASRSEMHQLFISFFFYILINSSRNRSVQKKKERKKNKTCHIECNPRGKTRGQRCTTEWKANIKKGIGIKTEQDDTRKQTSGGMYSCICSASPALASSLHHVPNRLPSRGASTCHSVDHRDPARVHHDPGIHHELRR